MRNSPADATPDGAPPQDADALFELFYQRLKAMAGRRLAGSRDTLDTTALVHELYLRVTRNRELAFDQPAQFFAYAARAMRHLLGDRARDRLRKKAGGDWVQITLTGDDGAGIAVESAERALAIEEALGRLEQIDPRAARVVELRWFTGIEAEKIATLLGVTRRTVDRDWRFACAFLQAALE